MNKILSKYDNPLIIYYDRLSGNFADIMRLGYVKSKDAINYQFYFQKVKGGSGMIQNLM